MTEYPQPPIGEHVVHRIGLSDRRVGGVRLVCIDGPAGSGKTTYASALAAALAPAYGAVPIVHGDEVYEGWPVVEQAGDRLLAFAELGRRLTTWLVTPWEQGYDAEYPRWNWHAGAWDDSVRVPAAAVVILEGVGLGQSALRSKAALTVWVDAEESLRLPRVLARDGEAIRDEMIAWQRDEQAWFTLDGTLAGADVVVVTG